MIVRELRGCRCPDPYRVENGRCVSCRRCLLDNDEDEIKEEGPPPPPTNARPGTEAKLRVLEWRVQHDFRLWSPEDATE
jgi:hypothetical protein